MHFTGCPPIFRRIFGRQRDFFDSNVWRLQQGKNEKSVISLSTFFCRDSKVRKSGARTSAPRVVVGVVEEGGRGGGGRWSGWWRKVVGVVEEGGQMEDVVKNGKDICVFCEAKHTS